MWSNLSGVFQKELDKGEQILWAGQPRQGFMLRNSDAFAIPTSLIIGGLMVDGLTFNPRNVNPAALAVSLVFTLIALYVVAGRFFLDSLRRSKTYYALTNQRIIIINSFIIWDVKSLDMGRLAEITLGNINRQGEGTITIGHTNQFDWIYEGIFLQPLRNRSPRLDMIADARSVYDQTRAAQTKADTRYSQG